MILARRNQMLSASEDLRHQRHQLPSAEDTEVMLVAVERNAIGRDFAAPARAKDVVRPDWRPSCANVAITILCLCGGGRAGRGTCCADIRWLARGRRTRQYGA